MAALRPLVKPKVVKKRTKKVIRHHSHRCVKIKHNWEKPRDTDNRGNNKKTKHMSPSGFRKLLVHSVKELEVLPMPNRSYCAEISHGVSSKNHKASVERAASQPSASQILMPAAQQRK
ncbi:60s ribosomal protein l32-like [Lynx pardinus]|uniref:60s ribosomal protein l32-like n=1 Tax=Lynx pardinus TaxID=191816 RepID=A0A485MCB0_LYNPA|nr:60s ribosomal protein l32-like [Lynx pardinus]